MDLADLATLPLNERLAAMETLWDSLARDAAHDPSPAWHADVLEARRQQLNEGRASPWEEVRRGLHRLADGSPPQRR